jgi:RND family efflux transporter MFP subunit
MATGALGLLLGACGGETPQKQVQKPPPASPAGSIVVSEQEIEDLKAVLATVRSKKVVDARVRTPGSVATLKVTEGAHVEPGQVLALVTDPKIALRIKASDAQIVALESRVASAKAELERTAELQRRGVAPQARLDTAKTAFDVATNDLSAARAEREVIERQIEEGQVLAPASGRILRVPVTEGSVVMAGESIASVAANEYLVRLEVPERHARFMKKGDAIAVGRRGLGAEQQGTTQGRIVQVYPEIQGGRVIADAEVAGLGDFFVGERVLAWIAAGKRKAVLVPREAIFARHGLDYVRLTGEGGRSVEVVVQIGQSSPVAPGKSELVEVLAGVRAGDRLVQP